MKGGGSKDYLNTKRWAFSNPASFSQLIDILVESVATHLIAQIEAGVDAVQIFDSWAGVLPPSQFTKWVIEPTKRITDKVKEKYPSVPIIGFPRGAGALYKEYFQQAGVDAISFDQFTPAHWVKDNISIPVQGNLDPVILASNKELIIEETQRILDTFKDVPFIFNLGHGVIPETPVENVELLLKAIKG